MRAMHACLCAFVFVALPAPVVAQSRACQLPLAWNLQELVGNSDYVFRALARSGELTTANRLIGAAGEPAWVKVNYELIERVKGDPPVKGTLWTTFLDESGCGGSPVIVGQDYLFMVTSLGNPQQGGDDAVGYIRPLGLQVLTRIEPTADAPLLRAIREMAAR